MDAIEVARAAQRAQRAALRAQRAALTQERAAVRRSERQAAAAVGRQWRLCGETLRVVLIVFVLAFVPSVWFCVKVKASYGRNLQTRCSSPRFKPTTLGELQR